MPPTRSISSYTNIPTFLSQTIPPPPRRRFGHLNQEDDVQPGDVEAHPIVIKDEDVEVFQQGLPAPRSPSAPVTRVGTPAATPAASLNQRGTATPAPAAAVKLSPAELYLAFEDPHASVSSDGYHTAPLASESIVASPAQGPSPSSESDEDSDYAPSDEDEGIRLVAKGVRKCRAPPGYPSNTSGLCHWWHTKSRDLISQPLEANRIIPRAPGDIVWHQYLADGDQENVYWVWNGVQWESAEIGSRHPIYGLEKLLKHDLEGRNKGPQWVAATTYRRWEADMFKNGSLFT